MKHRFLVLLAVIFLAMWACGRDGVPGGQVRITDTPIITLTPILPILPILPTETLMPIPTIKKDYPPVSPGLPDNIITFAIDDSSSIPQNCSLANARYDIPNLFVPLLGQYYDETLVNSSLETKFSPWVEVLHWPLWKRDQGRSYDVFPMPASNIDYNNFKVSTNKGVSGTFFGSVFNYLQDLPLFDANPKPNKRTLILLTDGVFQQEAGGGEESKIQAEDALKALDSINSQGSVENSQGNVKFDVHVVLLCPERIDHNDFNWWVSMEALHPTWFHLYKDSENFYDLSAKLWNGALRDKFSGTDKWDGYQKGIYLISNQGYQDLSSDSVDIRRFSSCKTAEAQERCINFQFSSESTGFHGAVISSIPLKDMPLMPFILSDDVFQQLQPAPRPGNWHMLWDSKVKPYDTCANDHSWVFDPGISENTHYSLFWWRSSSDLHLEIHEKENPTVFLGDDSVSDLPTSLSANVVTQSDFIPLQDFSSCYKVVLNINGIRSKNAQSIQSNIEWNLKKEIIDAYPDILTVNHFKNSELVIKPEILNAKDELANLVGENEETIFYKAGVGMQSKFIYPPSFVDNAYSPCQMSEPIVSVPGLSSDAYKCSMTFEYVGKEYALYGMDDAYRPSFSIINNNAETCFPKVKIMENGYESRNGLVVNITPQLSGAVQRQKYEITIDQSFFKNNPSCADANSSWLYVDWNDWPKDLGWKPLPWVCNFSKNECYSKGE